MEPATDRRRLVALVDCRQRHAIQVGRPYTIVCPFQADVLIDHRLRQIQRPVLKQNVAPVVTFLTTKDWVTELACEHLQHVRHDPSWQQPWVTTPEGRPHVNAMTLLRID